MRLRLVAALSTVAVSALLLAGCSGSAEPDPTSSPSADACLVPASAGADSDAVTVTGSGAELSAEVPEGLGFAELQRTVVTTGDGPDVGTGSFVSGTYQVYDGATGDLVLDSTSTSATDDQLVPIVVDSSQLTLVGAAVDCVPLGSTVVLSIPGSALGDESSNYVVVARSVAELPTVATGAEQPAVEGMPTVTLAEDGAPTVEIPDTAAPTELEITDLKTGDGAVVEDGDQVTVQYYGVSWDTKENFDSSWSRGAPSAFLTTGVYEGFGKALVGQTVGSQVLVVMPPSMGDLNGDLKDQTLVFVIDILGTQHPSAE